jgi:WD40 repeat protein
MPDGNLISGGRDSTIRFWNAETRQLQRVIKEKAAISQLGCSPDGLRLITAFTNGTVAISDLKADTMIAELTAYLFALTSDGSTIATASADTLQLRDATNGEVHLQIPLHGNFIKALAFSPDGKSIAIGEYHEFREDDTVQVCDVATGELKVILATPEDDRADPLALAFVSEDTLVVASTRFLQTWDVVNTQRLWSTPIEVMDYVGRATINLLPAESGIVLFGQRIILTAPAEKHLPMLELRHITSDQIIRNYLPYYGGVTNLVFASARRALITTGWERFVQWSFPDGTLENISRFDNANELHCLGISPDGETLAKFSYNWEYAGSGRLVMYGASYTLVADQHDDIRFVVPGPNGQFCGYQTDRNFMLWSATTRATKEIAIKAIGARFSSDSRRLAILAKDGSIMIWDTKLDTVEWTIPPDTNGVVCMGFSYDGNFLATGHWKGGRITVWDLSGRSSIIQLNGHRGSVTSVAFSHRRGYLVSAGADSTIRTWVLATGINDYTYTGYPAAHSSVAVSADGKYIASITADGALILWNARGAIASVESQKYVAGSSTLRCYPTPSNSLVNIECELVRPALVDIRIMDQLGREVAQLADGELQSGTNRFTWDTQGVPAGIYHCRLRRSQEIVTVPIVLVH